MSEELKPCEIVDLPEGSVILNPPLIRHFFGRRVESRQLPEFVAGTDGWEHFVYAAVGDDWKKIGEGRTLAEAIDICRQDAEEPN